MVPVKEKLLFKKIGQFFNVFFVLLDIQYLKIKSSNICPIPIISPSLMITITREAVNFNSMP